MITDPQNTLYLDEPLFRLGGLSRFIVRLVSYVAHGIGLSAMIIFLLSDVPSLFYCGILLALFYGDFLLHIGGAEQDFTYPLGARVNIAEYLPSSTRDICEIALRRARALGGDFSLHLLQSLLQRNDVTAVLRRLDIPLDEFQARIAEKLATHTSPPLESTQDAILNDLQQILIGAFGVATRSQSFFVEPRDVLAALPAVSSSVATLFSLYTALPEDVEQAVAFSIAAGRLRRPWFWRPGTLTQFVHGPYKTKRHVMNRAWTARPTPTLDQFSEDLTDVAEDEAIGFLVGHQTEYDRMVDVLARPSHPNVLLVGEAGVGKETLVSHLALQMSKDRVPTPLFDKRLVLLRLGGLLAGAEPAELRARMQKIIDEVTLAGNVVLYIPDLHQLAKTSGAQSISGADILLPAIQSDAFSIIGGTFPREFKQYIESQSDFASSFDIIRVAEISESDAKRVLVYESMLFEAQYGITVTFSAIKKAVELAHQHFREKPLPSSAEELLKEAFADVADKKGVAIDVDNVITIAERKVNVPLRRAGKSEAETLLNLESIIHERFIDQEEAVGAVARALREYRSGLSRKGGPIATFLFVGPTGVGKTELAKILAKLQFGSKDAMVRFDMSEFQDKQSFFRFIGSPDGSVSGALTDAILQKPYSLVLLDEFEKAHPDILNLFLQVFDDGRLTDNLARTVDFQNTIIIATSNAHSAFIKESLEAGKTIADIAAELKKKLVDFFRPELLNRFSGVIVFKTLAFEDVHHIAKLQLEELAATAKEAQGVDLTFDDAAILEIAKLGFDPVFGARPLRGVIAERLRSILAESILRGEVNRGESISVVLQDGKFIFKNSL